MLISSHHTSYCREPNICRERCISGKSEQRTIQLEEEEIAILADEYARWRSDTYLVMTLASSEQKTRFKTLVQNQCFKPEII